MASYKAVQRSLKVDLDEKKEDLLLNRRLLNITQVAIEFWSKEKKFNSIIRFNEEDDKFLKNKKTELETYKAKIEVNEQEIKDLELKLTNYEPKSVSEWTCAQLKDFKIETYIVKEFKAFFGMDRILYEHFNEKVKEFHSEFKKIYPFMKHKDLIQLNSAKDLLVKEAIFQASYIANKDSCSKSEVDLFGFLLLAMFDLRCRSFEIEKKQELDLEMSLDKTHANPDLMLRSIDGSIIALLLKSKFYDNAKKHDEKAKSQLVGELIAVYQSNKEHQNSPSDKQEFFGIILNKKIPKFYKIVITDELANAVKAGRYPTMRTLLYELEFDIETEAKKYAIFDESYRLNVIQSFLALREIIEKLDKDATLKQ